MALLPCASCQAVFPAGDGMEWWCLWLRLDILSDGWEAISAFQGWPIGALTTAFYH